MQSNQATRGIGHGEIMEALAAGLPGATAHLRMLPPGRAYVEAGEVPAEALESGVLVVLFEDRERIYTCLIKRPAHMKVHAGQVGFPGGRREPSDTNTLDTALREAFEETGIQPETVAVVGPLTPLYIPVSRFVIYPWLAWSPSIPRFLLNREEAEKIILFPFPSAGEALQVITTFTDSVTGRLGVPAFSFDGETIWGATSMILSEVAEVMARIRPLR